MKAGIALKIETNIKQSLEPYEVWVKQRITDKRFTHTKGVVEKAVEMAELYNCDKYSASLAAICHDAAKRLPDHEMLEIATEAGLPIDPVELNTPNLLHGPIAAIICARELEINDQEVLNAICYHTTGRPLMSKLEQIIYLADLIEESRDYPGVGELRALSAVNLEAAMKAAFKQTIRFVLYKDEMIHPLTVSALNWVLTKKD